MTFANRSKLDYHNRIIHQEQVYVTVKGRKSKKNIFMSPFNFQLLVTIERVDGKFHCLCNIYSSANPTNLRNHMLKCQKIDIPISLNNEENESEDENMIENEEIEEDSFEIENSRIEDFFQKLLVFNGILN